MFLKKGKYRWVLIGAVFAIVCGAIFFFWNNSREYPPVFRWNDLYFVIPIHRRIGSEDSYQHSMYVGYKGECIGTIQWEGSQPVPEKNGESYWIAAGTKIYTIDPAVAEEKELSFCGLLVETEGGSLHFAYPYSPHPQSEDVMDLGEKVYEAFYPEFASD